MKTRIQTSVMIDVNLKDLAVDKAKENGKTLSTLINELLWKYVAEPTEAQMKAINENPALKALIERLF